MLGEAKPFQYGVYFMWSLNKVNYYRKRERHMLGREDVNANFCLPLLYV